MTYLDLMRKADYQLDYGEITLGEYEQMLKPLEREVQPEVVRCGECKHNGTHNCLLNLWATIFNSKPKDDFYCGMAERRTDVDD